jgi:hypothetical protein
VIMLHHSTMLPWTLELSDIPYLQHITVIGRDKTPR